MVLKYDYPVNISGNLDVLREWNRTFLPTEEREVRRNNAVYNFQGNRNPFIDYPELVDAIWG